MLASPQACALRLLAGTAAALLLICLVVLPGGPSESGETWSWVLAFLVALPAGLAVGARQERRLAPAAPAATARALAAGLALLAYGLFLRHSGDGDRLHHLLLALSAAAALAAPFLAARIWRDPDDDAATAARALAVSAAAVLVLLFVPGPALRPPALVPALALAGLAYLLVRARWAPPPRLRRPLDAAVCLAIVLLVAQFPDLRLYAQNLVHHQGFFLGPANDVAHGRAMLAGAWSQYGVGLVDALGMAFLVLPAGYGSLSLLVVAVTVAQYLCLYAIVRLAGVGLLLAVLTLAVAALGNLFAPIDVYVVFPSATALRFGLPYLLVLLAVLGARYPQREWATRDLGLAVLALAAVWSFETFVYCAATYAALALSEAIVSARPLQRLLAAAARGLAVSAGAVLLFSLFTLLLYGQLDWGPYLEYLDLYSAEGFGQLPVTVFSAGPAMGLAIFLSAVTLLWLLRERPQSVPVPLATALAGFTGIAVATFTYYLGRSHPNNLLNLLVPVVALGGLWAQLLLSGRAERWRLAGVATLLIAGAMVATAAWPSFARDWRDTAGGVLVDGESLPAAVDRLAGNPVLDPRAPAAAALLDRLPPGPAAVLTEPELTTEVLARAGRRNLLPISDPAEDSLIRSSAGRLLAAVEALPAGTMLLTSPAPWPPDQASPTGQYRDFDVMQTAALGALARRFELVPQARTAAGIELVRLEERPAR